MNEPTDDDRALARKFHATWNDASVKYASDNRGERRDWLAVVALHKSLLPQPLPADVEELAEAVYAAASLKPSWQLPEASNGARNVCRRTARALLARYSLPRPLPAGGVAYEACCGKPETCNRGCIHRGRYLERTDAEAIRRYFASLGNQEWHDSRDGLVAPVNAPADAEAVRLKALLDHHCAECEKKDAEIERLANLRVKDFASFADLRADAQKWRNHHARAEAEIARLTAERDKYRAQAEAAGRLTALEQAVVGTSEQYWTSLQNVPYVDWRRAAQALISARKPPAPPLTPTPGQVAFEAWNKACPSGPGISPVTWESHSDGPRAAWEAAVLAARGAKA